jgi:hypothetical protein
MIIKQEANDWKGAVKAIRQAGIRVKTSINSCCPGCIETEKEGIIDGQPLLFSLRSRFNGSDGGVLYHQNIAGTELADKLDDILYDHRLIYQWDKSGNKAIIMDLDPETPRRRYE